MIKDSHLFRPSKLRLGVSHSARSAARSRTLSRWLWALTLTSGALVSASFGQEGELEEIQITGSRITRTTMETPTPVTTIQAEDLAKMAPGNLIEGLSQMPMFYNNQNQEQVNGGQNSGGSNVNMRGAGTNRTLTLLNGRRVVSSNRFGTVDVNLFPEDLLRSVESVTGGASASYGTDAVAGVVNFILNNDYTGLKTHAQTGINEIGDGSNYEVGIAGGMDITDKLHIIGSLGTFEQRPISSFKGLTERPFLKQWARVTNPDASGPTEIVRPYVKPTNFTNQGVLVDPARPGVNRLEFQRDGSLKPIAFSGVGVMNTGCLCYAEPSQTYGVNSDDEVGNYFRRHNAFVYTDYELNENVTLFGQVIFAQNHASDQRESISLLSGWQGRIYPDNAFLKPEVAALLTSNGVNNVTGINYGFFGLNVPDTPLGESRQNTVNEMYSFTTGFDAELSTGGFLDGWSVNGYGQFGKNVQDFVTENGVRVDRMQFAMDAVRDPATGNIICRVNLPQFTGSIAAGGNGGLFQDCAPINTFGGVQNISKAGADYIMDRDGKIARQWTDQWVYELSANGELFSGFGAGSIDAAVGASYRKESLDQQTLDVGDEFPAQVDGTLLSAQGIAPWGVRGVIPQGSTVIPGYNGIPGLRFVPAGYLGDANSSSVLFSSLRQIAGSFTVKEAFGEINIPLLADVAFADYVEINTSARWADYSGSGNVWAWKLGLNWTINDQLRFRATQSRDVRAASLRERFDQTRGGINVRNPWANNALVSAASLSGGNPNVTPEEADTTTVGFVYQPALLENFSASVDWYSIDIQDAIAQLGSQNIVDSCRNGDVTLCQYVITPTGPVTNPTTATGVQIDRVEALFINLANQRIEGADMELTYRTDIDLFGSGTEQLGWRFLYSWLDENSIQNPGAFRDDRVGQIGGFGFARNKVNTSFTYSYDTFSVFLQARWTDGGLLDRTFVESSRVLPNTARPSPIVTLCGTNTCTIDDNSIASITYVDLRLGKTFGDNDQLEVYGNVNNLLDREPNITAGAVGRTGVGLGVNAGLYDILGRRYTIGVNYEF